MSRRDDRTRLTDLGDAAPLFRFPSFFLCHRCGSRSTLAAPGLRLLAGYEISKGIIVYRRGWDIGIHDGGG